MSDYQFVKQINSTNELLWKMIRERELPEGFVLYTDFQTAGKGQIGNSWESEAGKNLLFSMVIFPKQIPIEQQFLISQLVSLAIKNVLDKYTDHISIKWPNDIYWNDKKLGGILIENSLQGKSFKAVVIGIGLNVNQKEFRSDAPNPVSLIQITGKSIGRRKMMHDIQENIIKSCQNLDASQIRRQYANALYRRNGFYLYRSDNEQFEAEICSVHPDGQLELQTLSGERKGFYFKEVQFVI